MTDRGAPATAPGDARRAALHAPFRPRLARVVSYVLAVGVLAMSVGLAVVVVPVSSVSGSPALDWISFLLFGVAAAWFLHRQASVRAVPAETGLTVRNLLITRRLEWAEIVSVRFGEGRPWVQLDLADGDTLAVMGVQRADGVRALREARRLATLVALHTRTRTDD